MQKRGALFYIIDAFVAASIIAITLTAILSSVLNEQPPTRAREELELFMTFLQETPLLSMPGDLGLDLIQQGLVSNPRASIIEAVVELNATGHDQEAGELVKDAALRGLAVQYGMNLSLIDSSGDDFLVYGRNQEKERKARLLLVKRVVVTFQQPGTLTLSDEPVTTDGEDACTPGTCLYVYDPAETTLKEKYLVDGCSSAPNGWVARCRDTTSPAMRSAIVEVSTWS
ncbi:hypothetical protein JXA12_00140 [Candidatus Woesearchaeota archaeon]|nr:hypothetical protein [Candidatus Woesearchaeota archaeon]